jgi:phosphate transport system protein
MAIHLRRDLENLQRDLVALAHVVELAVQKSIESLQRRDGDLALQVIAGDAAIDEQETRIEEECLKILALHQPVAIDLRLIVAAIKINSDLERMADLAEDIAERTLHLAGLPTVPVPDKLQSMTEVTSQMVRESLNAFITLDAALARRVCRKDDEVDRYNAEIIEELLATMKMSPKFLEPGVSMFSATRHLERIADHATNIAEDVVYLVEGKIIRHRPLSSSMSRPT